MTEIEAYNFGLGGAAMSNFIVKTLAAAITEAGAGEHQRERAAIIFRKKTEQLPEIAAEALGLFFAMQFDYVCDECLPHNDHAEA
jgi:hypothetical protein